MPADEMVTCSACGATGKDDVFCDGCGALLLNAASPPPADEPGPPPAAGPVMAADSASSAPDSPGATTLDFPAVTLDGPAAAPAPPADAYHRARPLVVPVSDPAQAGQVARVTPVLPGLPEPTRPVVRGPDTDGLMTGPPCPWCSTPNPLDRHFCRRCAMLLALRPDPDHLPWWRRMFTWCRGLLWRRRELPYAGQRPRLRRGSGRLGRWLVLAVVVGLVAFAADTWGGIAVTNVKDHFAHPYPVPAAVTASHSDPAHPVADLDDTYNNTWWGTGEAGSGTGTYVTATFGQPVNLLDIIITPGAGIEQDAFTAQSRPESIKVTLTSASGSSTNTTITLADSPGPETFAIHGSGIASVRLTLESAYLAQVPARTEVAIAETEFFASSGGG